MGPHDVNKTIMRNQLQAHYLEQTLVFFLWVAKWVFLMRALLAI